MECGDTMRVILSARLQAGVTANVNLNGEAVMMAHLRSARTHTHRSSLLRTGCIAVAGLAIMFGTTSLQASQNGKRDDRGASAVQPQRQNNHNDRGHGNNGRNDRGRDRGHNHGGGHHDGGHHRGGHHDDRHHHHDTHLTIQIGGGWVEPTYRPVYRPAPRPSYAQLEYDRGYADAKVAGFVAGQADALAWRPFCDTANVCFDHVSTYYRAGYLAAYACAYKEGYQAGECERQTVRLRYSSHSRPRSILY